MQDSQYSEWYFTCEIVLDNSVLFIEIFDDVSAFGVIATSFEFDLTCTPTFYRLRHGCYQQTELDWTNSNSVSGVASCS